MPRNANGRIVILTGAGISAESGLGTFRDTDGIWTEYDLEDVATPEGYARNPGLVLDFYSARRANLRDARPNAAHTALARLEREYPGEVLVVTQNVDDMHEQAGTTKLIHMHGELLKSRCVTCGRTAEDAEPLTLDRACIGCAAAGTMRPHVVWFGEMPFEMDRIYNALATCDLFVSIGTSGNVYPAAGFVVEARMAGARTVELNLEPSEGMTHFDHAIHGPATKVVPAFVEAILSGAG